MDWRRVRERVDGDDLALVGTGGLEVGLRTVPDLLGEALDATLGLVLASVTVNVAVRDPFVLAAAQTAFLGTVFYSFGPTVFPGSAGERAAGDRPFRALLGSLAAVFALPVVLLSTGGWDALGGDGPLFLAYVLLAIAAVMVVLAAFLRATQEGRLVDPESPSTAVMRAGPNYDVETTKRQFAAVEAWAPLPRRALFGVLTVAVLASYVIPLVLLGFLGASLNAVFPVLECLVVAGLVLGAADEGTALGAWEGNHLSDVEPVFYDNLTTGSGTMTGAIATTTVALAVVTLVGATVVSVSAGLLDPDLAVTYWVDAGESVGQLLGGSGGTSAVWPPLVRAVSETGTIAAFPVAAGYGAWFWYREIQRLPAIPAVSAAPGSAAQEHRPVPARPVGLVVPAAALAVAWRLELVGMLRGIGVLYAPETVRVAFAFAWPVCLALVVASVWLTRRRDLAGRPQPVAGEGKALFVAFFSTMVTGLVTVQPLPQAVRLALLGTGLLAWAYYLQSLERWAERRGYRRAFAVGAYVAVLVGVAVPAVAVGVAPPVTLLTILAAAMLALREYLTVTLPDGPADESDDETGRSEGAEGQ